VGIGAGVEGGHDAPSDLLVVRELCQVLMAEVGSAVQLLRRDQAKDLSSLALASRLDASCRLVIGSPRLHESMVIGRAGGSLSIDGR